MRQPPCPYFNKCAGCSTQHIEYSLQLENKKKNLMQSFHIDDVKVFSGNEFNYRNRMEFLFNKNGPGLRRKDNSIINIDRCIIANDKINLLLLEVKNHFKDVDAFDFRRKTGTLCYVLIRTASEKSSISFVLNEDSNQIDCLVEKINSFSKLTTSDSVIITYTSSDSPDSISENYLVVKGNDTLNEVFLGNRFEYSVQGFFQNNTEVAKMMHNYVRSLLEKYLGKQIYLLDLYAGVGTFGINNSDLFKQVTIVESFQKCIDSAKFNISNNNISNAVAISLDAKKIKNLQFNKPLVVIIDPPRTGMHNETIATLNKLLPLSIIYVSCNLNQLRKDIPKFKRYTIKDVALFDQFPQTNHMEVVIELMLNNV